MLQAFLRSNPEKKHVAHCQRQLLSFILRLQDGAYSYSEFSRTFEEYDIQRVMRAYENSISINVHSCNEGDWNQDRINKEQFSEFCQVG
jgi:hypothetical protein